jgi:hypothetical protein
MWDEQNPSPGTDPAATSGTTRAAAGKIAVAVVGISGIVGLYLNFIPSNEYGGVLCIATLPVAWRLGGIAAAEAMRLSGNTVKARLQKAIVFAGFYLVTWSTFGYAVPTLLHHFIGETYDRQTRIKDTNYHYKALTCRHTVETFDVGGLFGDDICVGTELWRTLKPGMRVRIRGTRSWLGSHVDAVVKAETRGPGRSDVSP